MGGFSDFLGRGETLLSVLSLDGRPLRLGLSDLAERLTTGLTIAGLTGSGVVGALGDPTLELHDSNGALIASNNNWRSDQEAEIIATTIPPTNDLESAILRNITPGNYTAIVRGVNGTTGVALVEAYALN